MRRELAVPFSTCDVEIPAIHEAQRTLQWKYDWFEHSIGNVFTAEWIVRDVWEGTYMAYVDAHLTECSWRVVFERIAGP